MSEIKIKNTNWAENIITYPNVYYPKNLKNIKTFFKENKNFAIQGNKRSFSDVALNHNDVISTKKLNKILKFDKKKGEIEVEGGVILNDILKKIVPNGWFVPVTPGSKYVSVGGMVANNIIGKNTKKNQIKYHIKKIKLFTPFFKLTECSPKKNKNLFDLTVGGFGLTGLIYSATLKLKKINNEKIDQEIYEFKNFENFFALTDKAKKFDYNVFWIDYFNKDKLVGLCYLGRDSMKKENTRLYSFNFKYLSYLTFLILRFIYSNYYMPKILNFVFRKFKKYFFRKTCSYNDFFYPQDNIPHWNKIYGKKGFFQVQFLIPANIFKTVMTQISDFFISNKIFSPFIILKKIDEKGHYLNFSGKGYSISFDFPINEKYETLSNFLITLFDKYKLKVNFTKDIITNKSNADAYKQFKNFQKQISLINSNKKIETLFSNRLNLIK